MKNIRIEIEVFCRIYVGEDVGEGERPSRLPDCIETVELARVEHLGETVQARDAVAGHFVNMLANSASPTAERIRHALR